MYTRFIAESIRRSPRRKAMVVAAVAMGSAIATAMLGVMLDIGDKVNRELRSAGANLLVTPKTATLPVEIGGIRATPVSKDDFIPEAQIPKIKSIFWQLNITGFAPMLNDSVSIDGRRVAVEGVWFNRQYRSAAGLQRTGIRELNSSWKVDGKWIDESDAAQSPDSCMPGANIAKQLQLSPGSEIRIYGRAFVVAGVLHTGGEEDDRILLRLDVLQRAIDRPGQTEAVQVGAITKPEDAFARKDPKTMNPTELERWNCTNYVSSIAHQIDEVLPMAKARPVWRIADNEGKVLSKISGLMLLIGLAALVSAGLTVWSVMAATMLERRGEIAIMQATGATRWMITALFGAEVAIEGLAGGLLGAAAGTWLARWVGRAVFQTPLDVPGILVPVVVLLAILVAIAGASHPLRQSLAAEPAVALREGV